MINSYYIYGPGVTEAMFDNSSARIGRLAQREFKTKLETSDCKSSFCGDPFKLTQKSPSPLDGGVEMPDGEHLLLENKMAPGEPKKSRGRGSQGLPNWFGLSTLDVGDFPMKKKKKTSAELFNEANAYQKIEKAVQIRENVGWSIPLLSKKKLQLKNKKDEREHQIGLLLNDFHHWAESKFDLEEAMGVVIPLLEEFRALRPSPRQLEAVKDLLKKSDWPVCLGLAYKNGCNREDCTYVHSVEECDNGDKEEKEEPERKVGSIKIPKKEAVLPDFIKGRNHKGIPLDEISRIFEFFHNSGFTFHFTPANIMNFPDSRDINASLEMMPCGASVRPGLVVHGAFKFSDLPVLSLGGERGLILTHAEMEAARAGVHLVSDCGRVIVTRNFIPNQLVDWTEHFCNYSTNISNLFTVELLRGEDTRTRIMRKYTEEILMKLSIEGAQFGRKAVYNRLYSLMKSRHGADIDDPARIFGWISSEEYLQLVKDTIELGRSQLPRRLENSVRCKLATALKSYEETHWWMRIKAAVTMATLGALVFVPPLFGFGINCVASWVGLTIPYMASATTILSGACLVGSVKPIWRSYELMTSELARNHHLLSANACEPLKISLLSKAFLKRQKCRNAKLEAAEETLEQGVLTCCIDELEDDEYVEMYGTTIRGANVVLPSKDLEELRAANIIRMGTKRPYNRKVFRKFKRFCQKIFKDFGSHKLDIMETHAYLVQQYGQKRADRMIVLYGMPYESFLDLCKEFVKDEAYCGKDPDNYKPRMIWSRDEWFVVNFGPWFFAMGKLIKKFMSKNGKYSSGCTPADVGEAGAIIDTFDNIFECDVSNWDGSLHSEFLDIELMFIETCVEGEPEQWFELQSRWKQVHGGATSVQGFIRMILDRARRSGDLWTSGFNSLLNYCIVLFALKKTPDSVDIYYVVLGDDGIGGVNDKLSARRITATYQLLGMDVTFISRESIYEATYCSGYFYPVGGKVMWGNMPFRQFSKFGINFGNHPERKHKGLLYGTAKGMLCSAGHVPIFGTFLRAICDSAEDEQVKEIRDNRHENPYRHQGGVVCYPEMDTYLWFAEKYNISIQQIFKIEEMLENTININMFPFVFEEELFLTCFRVDCDLDVDHPDSDTHLEENYELLKDAYDEEVEKLKMAEEMGVSAYDAGMIFGQEEALMDGAASYAPQAHAFLSWVSSYNLWIGTILHYWHNRVAVLCTLNKKSKKKKIVTPPKKKKSTSRGNKDDWKKAASNLIKSGSAALGSYVGGPVGGTLGGLAGNLLSSISGMGSYVVHSNSLNDVNVTFGCGSIRIKHREYIGDLFSNTAFTTTRLALNPGMATSFPWLKTLGALYESYIPHGLAVEFVSQAGMLTTTQGQGVIVIATQYDPEAAAFTSRRQMESHVYTTSGEVTSNQLHLIECDPRFRQNRELFIRHDTDGTTELRLSDLGVTTIAVDGSPADDALLGELWMAYDIELINPHLETSNYAVSDFAKISGTAYSNSSPFGTSSPTISGSLDITVGTTSNTNDTIFFPPLLDHGRYLVAFSWNGSVSAALSIGTVTLNSLQAIDAFDGNNSFSTSDSGANDDVFVYMAVVELSGTDASWKLASSLLPSSGAYHDAYIVKIGDWVDMKEMEEMTYDSAIKLFGVPVTHPSNRTKPQRLNFSGPLHPPHDEEKEFEPPEPESDEELYYSKIANKFRTTRRGN